MSFQLTRDFKTLEELHSSPDTILEQARETRRPVVITVNGKPKAVVLDVDTYERLIHNLNLSRMLHEAEEEIRAGKARPLEEFMKEFERDKKISRPRRSKSKA